MSKFEKLKPKSVKIATKDNESTKIKYKTERKDHKIILESLEFDYKCLNKENESLIRKK